MNNYLIFFCLACLAACGLGEKGPVSVWESDLLVLNKPTTGDPYQLPHFEFIDQDSQTISRKDIEGKVVVADFFFTSCPSICPVMTKQMYRLYEQYKDDRRVVFLSHTINPRFDSVPVLKAYANKLGKIDNESWHFLYGPLDSVHKMAVAYFEAMPVPDRDMPGNILHDGSFHLIDQQGRIRLRPRTVTHPDGSKDFEKSYKGNDPESVDQLARDIAFLLKEK